MGVVESSPNSRLQKSLYKYDVEEDSEEAAYLIGYIIQQMHRVFKNMIGTGIK